MPQSGDASQKAHALLERMGILSASPADLQSAAVDILVKQIDPHNLAWTATNPRWNEIAAIVRSDIATDGAYLITVQTQLNAKLVAKVQAEFRPDEVSSLLGFFGGRVGAQYLEFQTKLNELFAAGTRDMLAHTPAQQPPTSSTETTPVLKQRLQTLALSEDVIQMQQETRAAARAGDDSSVHAGDLLITHIAEAGGIKLDALSATYAGAMPAFRAFNESALGQHYLAALGGATLNRRSIMVPFIMNFASTEAQKYQPKWRHAYSPSGAATLMTPVSPGATENVRPHAPVMPVSLLATDDPARARSAMTCIQAANVEYGRAHQPLPDGATQSEALRQIIAKCRQQVGLPQVSQ